MATVHRARVIWSWIKEGLWLILLIPQIPLLLAGKWVLRGRRKQPVLILTDELVSVFAYFRLRAALHREGFPVIVLSTGHIASLTVQARRLAALLETFGIQGGILVAHGKAGLAALALPDSGRRRIQHLVTLGTPFHGSRLFLPLSFLPVFGDMSVGSDFLLLHRMNALLFPGFSPFSAFADEFIYPGNLGHFGQGRDLVLDRTGHMNLILDRENVDTIVQQITSLHPEQAEAPAKPVPEQAAAVEKRAPAKKAAKKKAGKTRR